MHTIHARQPETFLCPGCGIESSKVGMMAAIVSRDASAPGYVYLACEPCKEKHTSMTDDQRKWYVQKIENKIAKHPAKYKALRAGNGAAAQRIVEGYVQHGGNADKPLDALVAGVMGATTIADAEKVAKQTVEARDKAWFEESGGRRYRLRPVEAAEVAGMQMPYTPRFVLVIQTETGKRTKAMLPAGVEGWPDNDDFLEGALLAATDQPMPVGSAMLLDGWHAWRDLKTAL